MKSSDDRETRAQGSPETHRAGSGDGEPDAGTPAPKKKSRGARRAKSSRSLKSKGVKKPERKAPAPADDPKSSTASSSPDAARPDVADGPAPDGGAPTATVRTRRKPAARALDEAAGREAIKALGDAPTDADALAAWLAGFGIRIAREAIIDGHRPPFDYLVHAFFEGRASWDEREPRRPADCVVWASRGGGKTYLGAVATMLDLVFKPGIEVRILGGSLDQSRRMHAHLRRLFSHAPLVPTVKGDITERRLRLWNGSTVELLAQSQVSVRGTRVQKLRCDEVELFDPDVWEAAQLTTRSERLTIAGVGEREVRGAVECLSTMHLSQGLMHRLVREAGEGTRALFRWGVVDVLDRCGAEHACRAGDENGEAARALAASAAEDTGREGDCPLYQDCRGRAKRKTAGHVTVSDAVGMKRRVARATWESEMLCARTARAGSVYPEFDARVHVVDEAPPASVEVARWVAGIDFGYRTPTVILWGALDASNVLWIAGERCETGVRLEDHVRAMDAVALPRPAWIGADPAGSRADAQTGVSDLDVLRKAGHRVLARRLRVRVGLELVRARLAPAEGGARLFIHRRCEALIAALETYRFDPRHPERDEPLKDGPDHAADALRYLVVNLDMPPRTVRGSYTP